MNYDPKKYFKIYDNAQTKTSELLAQCKAKFPVWSYYDYTELDRQFPPPKKAKTRYFKKVVEADKENRNKSLEQCQKEGLEIITFRERLIMELQYYEETGEHLDRDSATITGSLDSDGYAVDVYWGGSVGVRQYGVRDADPHWASRAAVYLETSPLSPSDLKSAIETVKNAGYKIFKKI